jgi:hypothetical protein
VQFLPLDQAEQADYIIELPIEKGPCPGPYPNRTLVLDESDGPVHLAFAGRFWGEELPRPPMSPLRNPLFLAAFKRSFVWKDTSAYVEQHFQGMQYPSTPRACFFPIQYPIRSVFIPEQYPRWEDRQLNMSNVLRLEHWTDESLVQPEGARIATRVSCRSCIAAAAAAHAYSTCLVAVS